MIRLSIQTDPFDDQIQRVMAHLCVDETKKYYLDSLEEMGLHERDKELSNLSEFVSMWTTQAETLRLPISIDKEVEQFGIELAMEEAV
jgi:hypothetical protein